MQLLGSISSIFGLLATFLQEREGRHDAQVHATIEEYTEWLRRREHAEAVSLLESNRDLMTAVHRMLSASHDDLHDRFDRLESILSHLLASNPDWSELIKSISPAAGLSEQAINILRWLDATGASMAIRVNTRARAVLVPNGRGGNYEASEPRFLTDDLMALVNLGLMIPGYGSDGSSNYTITRAAVEFLKYISSSVDGM